MNLLDISTKPPSLCSPSSPLSNEPNSTSLASLLAKLIYLYLVFSRTTLLAVQGSWRINTSNESVPFELCETGQGDRLWDEVIRFAWYKLWPTCCIQLTAGGHIPQWVFFRPESIYVKARLPQHSFIPLYLASIFDTWKPKDVVFHDIPSYLPSQWRIWGVVPWACVRGLIPQR